MTAVVEMSARTNGVASDHATFHGTTGSLVVDLAGQRIELAARTARARPSPSATRTAPAGPRRSTSSAPIRGGSPGTLTDFATGLGYMAFLEAVHRSAAERLPHRHRGRRTVKVLEFARSTILFRIDLDVLPPRTLSHKPPFAMNNARIQIDSVCRITERDSGRRHTFVLGGDCKTERVGADADLFLDPNADFIPIFSDDAFMHIKTFARAGTQAQAVPAGLGRTERPAHARRSPTRSSTPTSTSSSARASGWRTARPSSRRSWPTTVIVGIHRLSTDRYDVEIEYPAKTINANERDIVYQTDTGPILWPDLERDPARPADRSRARLHGRQRARLGRRSSSARRTPIADGVEVYHYADSIRVEGIANEFYRLPTPQPRPAGGSTCRRERRPPGGSVMKITAIESRRHRLRHRRGLGRGIMPEAIHSTWYEYSFDTFHTDEGIVGYTMQNANVRDGGR